MKSDAWSATRRQAACEAVLRLALGFVGLAVLSAAAIPRVAYAQPASGHHAGHDSADAVDQEAGSAPESQDRGSPHHGDHSCCPEHGCCATPAAAGKAPAAPQTHLSTAPVAATLPAEPFVYRRPRYLLPMWIGPPGTATI
jgi:hypothetical protein